MRTYPRTVAALPFLALLVACTQGEKRAYTVTDSADVAVVTNTETGLWTPADQWTLEEEVRFGAVDDDPDYQLGQVGGLAVGSDGRIYVSDIQGRHIKVFSDDGQYLQTIGAPGDGPGELGRNTAFVLLTAGDTLIVPDLTNQRINRYAPDGTALPSAPVLLERGRPMRFKATPDGVVTAQVRLPISRSTDVIVVVRSSGTFGDTLMTFPSGGANSVPGEIRQFSPEPMWDVTDSLTVLMGVNNEYRIGKYDRHGSLTSIFTKAYEPVPVTERDLRAFYAYLDRAWLAAGVRPGRLPELHARTHFADFYPAYMSIQSGYHGSIWVQRIQTPGELTDEEIERYNFLEEFGSPNWDVFDNTGKFLGVVTMPSRFQPRLFRDDKIYGVWRDDLDVQHVMRLRIVEGTGRPPIHSVQ